MQRQTPMALAETASIFCETIMVEAGLAATPPDAAARPARHRPAGRVPGRGRHPQPVPVRARAVRAAPAPGPLGRRAERAHARRPARRPTATALDPTTLHPYMWAVKGHYFTPFYNWPYTFGLLFGIGLYARYQDDPDRFRAGYDDLLSATGLDDAAGLAGRFGIDVRADRVLGVQPRRAAGPHRRLRSPGRRSRPRRDRSPTWSCPSTWPWSTPTCCGGSRS